jgi:FAD dependent oxidoreductase
MRKFATAMTTDGAANEPVMPNGPFPVPNATIPFWRTEIDEFDTHRTTEELPTECDVLIIGAGLSGASTAYYMLLDNENTPPPRILLLEAREICSGATGRNGIF